MIRTERARARVQGDSTQQRMTRHQQQRPQPVRTWVVPGALVPSINERAAIQKRARLMFSFRTSIRIDRETLRAAATVAMQSYMQCVDSLPPEQCILTPEQVKVAVTPGSTPGDTWYSFTVTASEQQAAAIRAATLIWGAALWVHTEDTMGVEHHLKAMPCLRMNPKDPMHLIRIDLITDDNHGAALLTPEHMKTMLEMSAGQEPIQVVWVAEMGAEAGGDRTTLNLGPAIIRNFLPKEEAGTGRYYALLSGGHELTNAGARGIQWETARESAPAEQLKQRTVAYIQRTSLSCPSPPQPDSAPALQSSPQRAGRRHRWTLQRLGKWPRLPSPPLRPIMPTSQSQTG